ncbi:MAG TPA: T9SS type A sorting domain-containing protein [Saprospiraceae bacterium]|nr:T9SS type A sorting domain-containing protein [Saprospiraceae bacterium]
MIKMFSNGLIDSVNQVFDLGPRLSSELQVMPNPSWDYVDVTLEGGVINALQIYNTEGRLMLTTESSVQRKRLDVGHFPQGIYYIVVNGAYVQRFVVGN